MKPNNYIQNSDYLSFAQVYKVSQTVTFSARTVGQSTTTSYDQTFNVGSEIGAIDRCFVKINSSVLLAGQWFDYSPTNSTSQIERFLISRSSPDTIKVSETILNGTASSWNAPAATLNISRLTFKPPNTT